MNVEKPIEALELIACGAYPHPEDIARDALAEYRASQATDLLTAAPLVEALRQVLWFEDRPNQFRTDSTVRKWREALQRAEAIKAHSEVVWRLARLGTYLLTVLSDCEHTRYAVDLDGGRCECWHCECAKMRPIYAALPPEIIDYVRKGKNDS